MRSVLSLNPHQVLSTQWEHGHLTYGNRNDFHQLTIRMVDG